MIIVPISGGKDSQACLKLALETKNIVIGLFCDTGFEHPKTYQHIENMKKFYNVEIIKLSEGKSVFTESLIKSRFPDQRFRFCTSNLKIRPSKRWYEKFAIKNGGFEVWLGVRKDESIARSKRYIGRIGDELIKPNDFMSDYPKRMAKNGIMFRLPIIDWSTQDVFDYVGAENLNPLYSEGFKRVGCFPCLATSNKNMKQAFDHDDFGKQQFKNIQIIELLINKKVYRNEVVKSECSVCNI